MKPSFRASTTHRFAERGGAAVEASLAAVAGFALRHGQGLVFWRNIRTGGTILTRRKLCLGFMPHETASNADYGLYRERSRVLRLLPVPFSLLAVSAFIGIYLARSRWRGMSRLLLLLGVLLLTPLVFSPPSVSASRRAAAGGLCRPRLRSGPRRLRIRPRSIVLPAAALLVALLVLGWPWSMVRDIDRSHRAHFHQTLGIRLFEQGQGGAARDSFKRALALRPGLPDPLVPGAPAGGRWRLCLRAGRVAEGGPFLRPRHGMGPGRRGTRAPTRCRIALKN